MSEENLITEGMVKKATYLIHKLADRRGQDFKEIQKKCKKALGYENLAKVTLSEGHAIIDKLVELTGGEEEGIPQGARVTDDDPHHNTTKQEVSSVNLHPGADAELEADIGDLAKTMLFCVRESKAIVRAEFGKENLTEGTRATLIKSYAATIFIEAGKRGLGR
jgi:hypothetical protein